MSLSDPRDGNEPRHHQPLGPPEAAQTGQRPAVRTATTDGAAPPPTTPASPVVAGGGGGGDPKPPAGGGPLVEVGFWADPRDEGDPRPDPATLVDEAWGATAAARAVELYARSGFLESFELGYSFCRLGCSSGVGSGGAAAPGGGGGGSKGGGGKGFFFRAPASAAPAGAAASGSGGGGGGAECSKFMGCTTLTDGKYVWPEGLAHYVSVHAVRPPEDFVRHSLGNLRALRAAQAGGRRRWDVDDGGKGRTVPLAPGTAVFLRDKTTLGIALPPEPEVPKRAPSGSSERGLLRPCMIS